MRYLFEKIKYSQFYKRYIKELALTKYLRLVRDIFVRIKKKLNGILKPKSKVPDLLDVFSDLLVGRHIEYTKTGEAVDVIIPIYNGYDYLVRLFLDITKTNMKCRFILVDDKSTDERVHELEKRFVEEHDNAILLENDQNYGFVKTVNHGLEVSTGHVALVNTDTELPNEWLERLIEPILRDATIASTTPYTNSGTIYSFPNFGTNNEIYLGKDVDTIDEYFRQIKPRYVDAPTGVGFCMGMNRKAIDEIGVLDYETYERGFGEENDWCQRAKKYGYKNVQVENLFVYHKHGGSYLSEEKRHLIEEHLQRLYKRYPTYDYQVQKYIAKDPNSHVRSLVRMLIDSHEKESILYFDHNMGGGATSYMNIQIQRLLGEGASVAVIRFLTMENKFEFDFYCDGDNIQTYTFSQFEQIHEIGKHLEFDKIYINELVTYPNLWDVQHNIVRFAKEQNSELIMLFHDYFAICPSINLLDKGQRFCEDATGETCEDCYRRNEYANHYDCQSHREWCSHWKSFLSECTEIRCFSEDTYNRVVRVYGDGLKLTLVPHEVNYLFPIHKNIKTTASLNIGLLGVLAVHKGGEVIRELLEEIEKKNLDINIRLIGWTDGVDLKKYSHFSATGRYRAEQLPQLVYENDIDIFLIASVWPETFSYTAEEIIKMGMPVMSFDMGAPAERIVRYRKGLVIDRNMDASGILNSICQFAKKLEDPQRVSYKKNIYTAEYLSFSSRYRLEHLQEELLYHGISGDFYEAKNLPKEMNWSNVGSLVIYRSRYRGRLKKFIQDAKNHGVQIIYDVDDLIFDVEQMDYTPDFDREVYGNFDEYAMEIYACMEQADKIIVSTENLERAVYNTFGEDKAVYVNRNVASGEMLSLSLMAREGKSRNRNTFTIGYFSGSNTHNDDFKLVADVLLEFMKNHDNVFLKIVGCMELPENYGDVMDRILRVEFLPWQELPREIGTVDLNLMPLQNTFFHHCKSENKWMEAALVEVATIASYYEELERVTQPDDNIILCKNSTDWAAELERLYRNSTERNRIAKNAYEYAVSYKTTLNRKQELLDIFRERQN